jgi:hypothetical protein
MPRIRRIRPRAWSVALNDFLTDRRTLKIEGGGGAHYLITAVKSWSAGWRRTFEMDTDGAHCNAVLRCRGPPKSERPRREPRPLDGKGGAGSPPQPLFALKSVTGWSRRGAPSPDPRVRSHRSPAGR